MYLYNVVLHLLKFDSKIYVQKKKQYLIDNRFGLAPPALAHDYCGAGAKVGEVKITSV